MIGVKVMTKNANISTSFFFCNFVEKHMLAVFVFFAFLCFMS